MLSILIPAYNEVTYSKLENPLDEAVRYFFKEKGIPNFIYSGSDYGICDKELAPYKKVSARRFPTMFIGKEVVDL